MRKVAFASQQSVSLSLLFFLKPNLLCVLMALLCLCCVSLACDTKCHRLHPNHLPPPSSSSSSEMSEKSHILKEDMNSNAYQEKLWDNQIQTALGNHRGSNPSRLGLACLAATLMGDF